MKLLMALYLIQLLMSFFWASKGQGSLVQQCETYVFLKEKILSECIVGTGIAHLQIEYTKII